MLFLCSSLINEKICFFVKWSVFLEALEKEHEPKRRADFNFTCLENNYDSFSDWKISGPKEFKELK